MSGLPKRPSPHEDPPAPTNTNPSNKRPHEETTSKSVQPAGHLLDQSQDSSARFSKAPRIENREERRPVQTSPAVQTSALVSVPAPAHHVLTQKTVLPLPSPSAVVSAEQKSNKESADVAVEKVSVPVPVQSGTGTTNKAGNSTGVSNKSGTNQDETKTPPTNGTNTNTSTPNPNPSLNVRLSNPNPNSNPNPSIPTWGFPPVPVPPSNNQPSLPSSTPPVPPTSDTTNTGTSTGTAPPDALKKDTKLPKESPKPPTELPPPATTTPIHIDSAKDNINNNTENKTSATAHVTSATAHMTSATAHVTSATAHVTSATAHVTSGQVTSAAGQVTSAGGQGHVAEQVQTQKRRQQRVARGGVGLTGNREPRFRSRLREDGLQGKGEASVIIYKAGECMQELLKSWREFKESQKDPKNGDNSQIGPLLEIRIPSEYVISTNRQVKGAQLWGTDIYTNDSDLVAVLMHMGYCSPSSSPPPSAIQELKATIRVLPPQKFYTSTLRNNVRSRAWGEGISCSYRVENCFIVKKGGDLIELEPRLQHTSGLEPTLAPVSVERTMTTRSAASNALRQQKFVREVTVQYNLCNEPWLKYSINAVADKGLKKSQYTSARLKRGEVLYLETHFNRYELSFAGEKSTTSHPHPNPNSSSSSDHHPNPNPNSHHHQNGSSSEDLADSFRWTRCRKPMPEPVMRTLGIPLPAEHLEILADNLEWEEIQWSSNGVWVGDKEYSLARVQFISPK